MTTVLYATWQQLFRHIYLKMTSVSSTMIVLSNAIFFWNAESLTWLLTSCTRHDKVGEENWGLPTHYARNGGMYHHFVANGYRVAKKVCLYGCLFARVFFSTREVCNKSCWKLRRSGPPWDRVRLCNLRSMTVGVVDPALNDSGRSFGVSDRSFWGCCWTLLCLTFRNNGRFFWRRAK